MGDTFEHCLRNIQETIHLLSTLGFSINVKKSVTTPTKKLEHLGFIIDSEKMLVYLNKEKREKIEHWASLLKKSHSLKIRTVAKGIGIFVSCSPAVQHAPLYHKQLEIKKSRALAQNRGNFEANPKRISLRNADVTLQTDASNLGWGAKGENTEAIGGKWAGEDKFQHINYLELKAALLGLQALYDNLRNCHILLQLDNMTAVSYIKNMGGTHSLLCNKLAKEIWNIWLSATHIPGVTNVEADKASRKFNDRTEWQLNPCMFDKIIQIWKRPEIDMFASRINYQFKPFASWKPDPEAQAINAFTLNWHDKYMWIFPPFSLMSDVLKKLREDQGKAIIIAPIWPTQAWWPRLCQMLIDKPVELANKKRLLILPSDQNKIHPLFPKLRIMACLLSGKSCNNNNYQPEFRKLF